MLRFLCIFWSFALSTLTTHGWSTKPAPRTAAGFDTSQLIDVTGVHAFEPAGPNDLRGPCVGLNLLANHGYIPRNGMVSVENAFLATIEVFGVGADIAAIASVLALFYAVDLSLLNLLKLEFSIGGPPSGALLGIFHSSVGLINTHNQFESDSSAMRDDLGEHGDNYSAQPKLIQGFLDLLGAGPNPDFRDVIAHHRINRYHQSVEYNPIFFYGPVEMMVSSVTHCLITTLANHSAEYPDGYLTREIILSMYGVQEKPNPNGNGTILIATRGTERIPDGHYRRPVDDPYLFATHAQFDLLNMWTAAPETLIPGGNTHGTNTFAPLDVTNFTNGLYSAAALLDGDNAACLAYQMVQLAILPSISNVEAVLAGVLADLQKLVGLPFLKIACPELEALKLEMLNQFPGYVKYAKGKSS